MSDDTGPGPASSAEPMIPKSRLDELIAERNQERQERQFLQNQLGEIARQRQVQRPEAEDPEMEELKSSNPVLYKKLKRQELETKQIRAGFSSVADQNDRLAYLLETGNDGKKMLPQVEQILKHEREVNRNFNVTRAGIFNYIKGQDLIRKEQEARQAPPKAPEPVDEDVPSSDPKFATTIKAGTASSSTVEKTREERIKELENVVF